MRPMTVAGAIAVLDDATERLPDLLQIRRLSAEPAQRSLALVTSAAIGWFTSWAIEAVSCPIVATRLACASSVCTSRYRCSLSRASASARLRSVRSSTKATTLLRVLRQTPPRRPARARGCRPCGNTPSRTVGRSRSSRAPSRAASVRSRHSGGVSSVQRRRPATRSSRSYPTICRNASLASMIAAFGSHDEDPDDVGVDQAPDLGFALFEIAVQAGILQRDRRLRGKQLQHRDPGRREGPRGQVVFEVERRRSAWPD